VVSAYCKTAFIKRVANEGTLRPVRLCRNHMIGDKVVVNCKRMHTGALSPSQSIGCLGSYTCHTLCADTAREIVLQDTQLAALGQENATAGRRPCIKNQRHPKLIGS
jgi:hypothetical protein